MPFSFPASPAVNDQSTQNGRTYSWSGYAWEIVATPATLPASVITSGTIDIARIPTGSSSSTVCIGNDARLSDTRTPTDNTVSTAKIQNDAVTYAKLQNVSATDRLLGRSSAGAGDVEEITCTSFGRSLIDDADAAAARTTLSVQPTASPAFTGAATFDNTGNVVPLTVTNTGTANSFVVNDASGDTTPFVIDAAGNVGIGVSSPTHKIDCGGEFRLRGTGPSSEAGKLHLYYVSDTNRATITTGSSGEIIVETGASSPATRLTISSTGTATFAGQIVGQAGASFTGAASATWNSTDGVQISRATIAGIAIGSTNTPSNANSFAGWSAYASDGTANVAGGTINFRANENWSSTNHGTDIQFRATPAGSGGSLTEVLRITGGGQTLVTAGSGSSGSYKPGMAISGDDDTGIHQVSGNANTLSIVTNGTERVRVDADGDVRIGTTGADVTVSDERLSVLGGAIGVKTSVTVPVGVWNTNTSGTRQYIYFYVNTGTLTGTINTDGTTTAYNTTSDYRLKTVTGKIADATRRLQSLLPCEYAWNSTGQSGEGFLAHELAQSVPHAVTGEKDAVNDDGSISPQQVDLAKVVPLLVAALQESNARIAALEERLNHA